jgi:hypothetical protein
MIGRKQALERWGRGPAARKKVTMEISVRSGALDEVLLANCGFQDEHCGQRTLSCHL